MAAKNDVTGDTINSRPASNLYRSNYDDIQWGVNKMADKRLEKGVVSGEVAGHRDYMAKRLAEITASSTTPDKQTRVQEVDEERKEPE